MVHTIRNGRYPSIIDQDVKREVLLFENSHKVFGGLKGGQVQNEVVQL